MKNSKPISPRGLLLRIGPGILVAATGVGAGDLATGAFTGNKLGVTVLWAVLLGAFLKFVLNEGLMRWQLVTGETLLEGAIHRLGRLVSFVFLGYLLLWSFFVGSALMSACGVTMHAIAPIFESAKVGKVVFGVLHSMLGLGLALFGGFVLFEKVMGFCIAVMFFVVLTTAGLVGSEWREIGVGLLIPRIPNLAGEGLGWTVALMGGVGGTLTVLCYGYWIRETGRTDTTYLASSRIDLGVAYLATAFFGAGMVIIGSAMPPLPPGGGATLVVQLAAALEQTSLGSVGKWAFLIGAWGAVFSSLLGVWQSVPYLFADFWQMFMTRPETPLNPVNRKGWPYRGYMLGIAIVPMLGLFVNFSQVQKVYAIFGALFMPMLALVLLILNGKKDWVGQFRNRPTTVGVLVATLLLFLFFGYLELQKQFG